MAFLALGYTCVRYRDVGVSLSLPSRRDLLAIVGSVFGALYEYTDNLAVPIVAHATYNVVLLLISYLAI